MWQLIVITAFLTPGFAATAFKKALDQKKNIYIERGTVIGGQSGQAFSLLKVRSRPYPKKSAERMVLNLGDEQGRLLKGRVSYFQVNLEPEKSRMVIHLAQVGQVKVTPEELNRAFKDSPFVSEARFVADPVDGSTSLVLQLKRQVKAEVFQLDDKGTPGRVVIDLIKR